MGTAHAAGVTGPQAEPGDDGWFGGRCCKDRVGWTTGTAIGTEGSRTRCSTASGADVKVVHGSCEGARPSRHQDYHHETGASVVDSLRVSAVDILRELGADNPRALGGGIGLCSPLLLLSTKPGE